MYRPDQFDFRLPDILHYVVCVQLLGQSSLISHRLVHRIALHANVDHSCHPHQQGPVFPELGQLATYPHFDRHRRGGCLVNGLSFGRYARICLTPLFVLGITGGHFGVLCGTDPVG